MEERLRPLLDSRDAAVWVAENEASVIGFVCCLLLPLVHRDVPTCRLATLVVTEQARSAGVGRTLVGQVETQARRWGCDRIEVTSGDDRPDAHRFYARESFRPKPHRFIKTLE